MLLQLVLISFHTSFLMESIATTACARPVIIALSLSNDKKMECADAISNPRPLTLEADTLLLSYREGEVFIMKKYVICLEKRANIYEI